jgi:hypothetical protein
MDVIPNKSIRSIKNLSQMDAGKYKELRRKLNQAKTTKEAESIYNQIIKLLK